MSNYPLLNLFLTMIADIFRDDQLNGWAKAGWTIFVCILPFLGVFVYLIARGRGMGERQHERVQRQEQAFRSYVRDAAGESEPVGTGSELERPAGLRNHGDLTEDEYQQAKSKLLAV